MRAPSPPRSPPRKPGKAASRPAPPPPTPDGIAAGQQRFLAQSGTINNVTVQLPVTVSVSAVTTNGSVTAFTGTLTYTATYTPYLGALVGIKSIPIASTSVVNTPVTAPYLNVEVMLDNSPSMEIAASPGDFATMQQKTPCSPSGAWYDRKQRLEPGTAGEPHRVRPSL